MPRKSSTTRKTHHRPHERKAGISGWENGSDCGANSCGPIPLVTKTLKVDFSPRPEKMVFAGHGGPLYLLMVQHGPRQKPADHERHHHEGTNHHRESKHTDRRGEPALKRAMAWSRLTPEGARSILKNLRRRLACTEPSKDGFAFRRRRPMDIAVTALDPGLRPKNKKWAIRVRLQIAEPARPRSAARRRVLC